MKIRIRSVEVRDGVCRVRFATGEGFAWAVWSGDVPEVGGEYHVEISTAAPPRGIEIGCAAETGCIDGDEDGTVRLGGRVLEVWDEGGGIGAAINVFGEQVLVELAPEQKRRVSVGALVVLEFGGIELVSVDL